ncbi:MAG: BMP family ABC transporter substrate-binding protein, partial [Spirochaetales bacterium]|nr:BMP family ABC transporter substrate-binding protein [Spirochaetales bacterium]
FSPLVPQDVRDLVAAEEKKIVDGTWDVFWGEVVDQDGNVVVAAGDKMDDGAMLGMGFFVEGVLGKAGN